MVEDGWCWSHTQGDGYAESHVCEVVGTCGHELFDLVAVHVGEVNCQLIPRYAKLRDGSCCPVVRVRNRLGIALVQRKAGR